MRVSPDSLALSWVVVRVLQTTNDRSDPRGDVLAAFCVCRPDRPVGKVGVGVSSFNLDTKQILLLAINIVSNFILIAW